MNLAFALQQLRRNLAALGLRRLVMLGVAGSVIFGSIAIGSYWIARSDYQLLYIGLSANDAGRIAAVLTEIHPVRDLDGWHEGIGAVERRGADARRSCGARAARECERRL